MSSKIKNIIIFLVVGGGIAFVYFYFFKSNGDQASLVTSSLNSVVQVTQTTGAPSSISADFLNLLLSVKNIKLNDTVLNDVVFNSLHDSSITLVPDQNEGRINPFAPLGSDSATPPATTPATVVPSSLDTLSTPAIPKTSTLPIPPIPKNSPTIPNTNKTNP